jgi:hypothetical protein
MNYTQQKNMLNNLFTEQLNTAQQMYAQSKIQEDGQIEQQLDEIQTTLARMETLHEQIADEIETTTAQIQQAVLENDVTITPDQSEENKEFTADQMMKDAQSLYDKHSILLFIKIAIVILILLKGNEVYASYKYVFVGASLACIFVYMMFLAFF